MSKTKYILLGIALFLFAGCSTTVKENPVKAPEPIIITNTVYVPLKIDETTYKICSKPTTILKDIPELAKYMKSGLESDLEGVSLPLIIKKYGLTKSDHISCYSAIVNIKAELAKSAKAVEAKNKPAKTKETKKK